MEAKKPVVSIITPSYNALPYIEETIKSVQQQTFQDWEMIIVDDCSTDNTPRILERYSAEDDRIRVLRLEENSGAATARNTGLQNVRGRYVAFLDSDDCWKREKLQKQLSFMQQNNYAFTFTAYEMVASDGSPLHKKVNAPPKVTYKDMLKNTIVGCLTVMIDCEKVGPFLMPNIRTRQDLATWLSILKKGINAYGLNESLAYYRVGNSSISKNKWKVAKMNWYVYRKLEKLSVIEASICFFHYVFNALAKRL